MPMKHLSERVGPELWLAIEEDDLSRVKTLTAGTVNTPNIWPNLWSDILSSAGVHGAVQVATYCLQKGVLVDDMTLTNMWANPRADAAYRLMVEKNAVDINHSIEWTGDMLGLSAWSGQHSLVRFCLERGADPNQTQMLEGGMPTLACAAMKSDPEMLAILLDHGATLERSGALFQAAKWGKLDCVKFLLTRRADVDEQEYLQFARRTATRTASPLCIAAERGHVAVVDELLQAGADVMIKNNAGKTALDIMKEKGMDSWKLHVVRQDEGGGKAARVLSSAELKERAMRARRPFTS